ncbi:lipoprotein insertase outer membrane protein LolB [Thalassotalea sp. G2M2-11]|uniref:lipoprotein insertase outer membrane protein LolB n=1 Tax=Thalassotalea sp. G2M2-11 TaxID=2787627 RepID=UPI0019D14E47|nr:lipoprotein insertase outer membrane protein LolB [Thalassotalea sp. G2M2-11]
MRHFFHLSLLTIALLLTACSSMVERNQSLEPIALSKAQRQSQLSNIDQWQVTGKLAFISSKKRHSANLFWQVNQKQASQTLKLTSYLGINVLSLSSEQGLHTVEVDGEQYQTTNLEQLIFHLTELTLPTQAMQHWLKGLTWSMQDQITYDTATGLPKQLSSVYDHQLWQIHYGDYQYYHQLPMATKITIEQGGLTIKIHINQWTL